MRRIEFINQIQSRPISAARRTPHDRLFDPIRASILFKLSGDIDEACWLVFLAIHCGRHRSRGWELVRALYAGDGPGREWTWARVRADTPAFRQWLDAMNRQWQQNGTRPRFGNHRKYESLDGSGRTGTGSVVESYVGWVLGAGGHAMLFQNALAHCHGDRLAAFDLLYQSMSPVARFGRLAKFDFLCMLGKCGLADIAPGHPYLKEATGPRKGAGKLFGSGARLRDTAAARLADALGVGMQVIEDALCNWAKAPDAYRAFRG